LPIINGSHQLIDAITCPFTHPGIHGEFFERLKSLVSEGTSQPTRSAFFVDPHKPGKMALGWNQMGRSDLYNQTIRAWKKYFIAHPSSPINPHVTVDANQWDSVSTTNPNGAFVLAARPTT
jgi:hypothetical protein